MTTPDPVRDRSSPVTSTLPAPRPGASLPTPGRTLHPKCGTGRARSRPGESHARYTASARSVRTSARAASAGYAE
ncbi:hypothetical protein ACFPRL_27480 [Pseudoclavibacter helvolus]